MGGGCRIIQAQSYLFMQIGQISKFIFLLVALLLVPVTAGAKLPSGMPVRKVPAALIDPGSGTNGYVLVVEKATQRLFLYEYKNSLFFLKAIFPVSTGESIGDKMKEGDTKTPEGFYIFNKKFIKRELAEIYGILAYPMDYPNFWDKRLGKAGDGIWLHGTNRELKPRDSNGCIALNNIDILALEDIIRLHETPIIVYDQIVYRDVRENKEEAKRIRNFIAAWKRAWERKDFRRYQSCYASDFQNNADLDYKAWMAHKARLNRKYKKIKIDIKQLRIFKHQGMIVATFKQYYKGDRFLSNGNKRLYLRPQGNGYKIVAEVWSPFPPKEPKKTLPLVVRNEVIQKARLARRRSAAMASASQVKADIEKEKVRLFLERWLTYWREKNIDGYISRYHPNFRFRNMNLAGFRNYKSRLFNKYREIFIGVRKLNVKINKSYAHVSFIQDFRTKQYQDRGIKKLILVKYRGEWRIKEESWDQINAGAKP